MKESDNKYNLPFREKNKFLDEFSKFIMGLALTNVVCLPFMFLNMYTFPIYIGSFIICVPSTFVGLTILKKKHDKKMLLDMYRQNQIMQALTEMNTYDIKIEKGKSFFWNEIKLAMNKRNINITDSNKNMINQLLYMINENYYEKISEDTTMSRDKLVAKVLDVILYYIERNGTNITDDDIKNIINSIFFIDDKTKDDMIKEFLDGKCVMNGLIDYRIISKNKSASSIFNGEIKAKAAKAPYFDYDDPLKYRYVINFLIEENSYKDYGDPSKIGYNLDLLKEIMSLIIVEYDDELKEELEKYIPVNLISSYIYNLTVYCLVNEKYNPGIYEMLNVFKNWNLLSFSLRLKIVNSIFDKYELDIKRHPFGVKNISHTSSQMKVLNFPSNKSFVEKNR